MSSNECHAYNAAMDELSSLIRRRDQQLQKLETIASLPLSISPRSGNVARFDIAAAQAILDNIRAETVRIQMCFEEVKQLAESAGLPPPTWLEMPAPSRTG